jgi:hypothetical protein
MTDSITVHCHSVQDVMTAYGSSGLTPHVQGLMDYRCYLALETETVISG